MLLTHLQHALPDVHPVVAVADAAAVERVHGVQAFRRSHLTAAESSAARASSVILGPGGHWHDYSMVQAGGLVGMLRSARISPAHMAQVPLLVTGYGGTVHMYGMGAGPLVDPAARDAVQLTGQLARSVSVRDQESLDLIRPLSASWPAEVVVAPDVVYGLALPTPASERRKTRYLAVNLRPWSDEGAQRRLLHEALFEAARAHGLAVVGVPLQDSNVPEREAFAAAAPADVDVELLSDAAHLAEFLAVLEGAEALVSMRLHANLLMHRLRRPALGLVYDPKVRSHFAQFGRQEFAHGLEDSPARLRQSLDRLLSDRGLPEHTQQIVADLKTRASAELHPLTQSLDAEPRRSLDPGWIQHLPPSAAPRPRARPAAEPWWPAGETLDLSRATVTASNLHAPDREVAFQRDTSPAGDRVAVDGHTLFTHDVTTWNARHSLWIGLRPAALKTTVTVRLEAVRVCADRNWGPSTPLTVERVRVQPWAARQYLVWGSSSPYAVPAGTEVPAPDPRPGLARRLVRTVRRRLR